MDAEKFSEYEKYNDNVYENYTKEKLQSLGIETTFDSFYFPEAGDCDAPKVCEFLLKDVEVKICNVEQISFKMDCGYALQLRRVGTRAHYNIKPKT